ncbi:MAG TPA: PIN domain-containing protein [Solirubrobacterales bacterium]|nr:PIN domain-containing protein [Solirubrobacterales bacterium]
MVFLDSSAPMMLVIREPETPALRRYLATRPQRIACQLVRTEVPRAIRHFGPRALAKARSVQQRVEIVRIDDDLLDVADLIDPAVVRSLDAIHLATAQLLARELEAVVTYESRMRIAAERIGLAVVAPT